MSADFELKPTHSTRPAVRWDFFRAGKENNQSGRAARQASLGRPNKADKSGHTKHVAFGRLGPPLSLSVRTCIGLPLLRDVIAILKRRPPVYVIIACLPAH